MTEIRRRGVLGRDRARRRNVEHAFSRLMSVRPFVSERVSIGLSLFLLLLQSSVTSQILEHVTYKLAITTRQMPGAVRAVPRL